MADLITGLNTDAYGNVRSWEEDRTEALKNRNKTTSPSATYGSTTQSVTHTTDDKASKALEMSDFLQLMVATFQNQTIDNTADISDMMNQMVQMSVVQTITNLNTLITNTMNQSYAASLLGKEVTITQQSGRTTTNITGTVTGTGNYNGEQVVYIGDKRYALSDITGVGRLPDNASAASTSTDKTADDLPDDDNLNAANTAKQADSADNTESVDNASNADNADSADNAGKIDNTDAEAAENGAESIAAENQAAAEQVSDAGEPDTGADDLRISDYDPATGTMLG